MGLFDSLPAPTKGAASPSGLGKRPSGVAEPSGNNKKLRELEPASREDQQAAAAAARAADGAACSSGGGSGQQAQPEAQLEAAYSEDKGSRLTMEDVAVIRLDAGTEATAGCRLSFVGIFDGHGGRNVASYAAENLHACVMAAGLDAEAARLAAALRAQAAEQGGTQQAAPQPSIKACKAAIAEGFRELDRRVLEQCASAGWNDGCTAVAVWVLGSTVLVANVGDARCVLARRPAVPAVAGAAQPSDEPRQQGQQAAAGAGEGRPQQGQQQPGGGAQQAEDRCKAITLTREHKAIFPQERQRIEKAGSFVSSDGRLAGRIEVSRAFGDRLFKKQGMSAAPDIQAFQVTPRDAFLLLACDGFWGVFGPQDAVDFVQRERQAKGHPPKQLCNRLIFEAIRERSCKDNCTVMLLALQGFGGGAGGDSNDGGGHGGTVPAS